MFAQRARPLQPAARVQGAGDRNHGCCRFSVCACLLLRPVRGCAPMSCAAVLPCCVAVARSRTNAIVLCCGVLVCSAVLRSVHMCGNQGKSRALHNTICQRALSVVSAVCPTLRAMQHRQHRRIATSLLVASGDAVSHHVVCDGPLSSC